MLKAILIGAGGHGRVVAETASLMGFSIDAYSDPNDVDWLHVPNVGRDEAVNFPAHGHVLIGVGGVTPGQMYDRHRMICAFIDRGCNVANIIHPAAIVSPTAHIGSRSQVMAGAVIQPGTHIGHNSIVNTRAVVEHDAVVGDGAHIGPGAIVLGGAVVGAMSVVGAGAVVLPGAKVPPDRIVPALTRYNGESNGIRQGSAHTGSEPPADQQGEVVPVAG